MSLVARFVAPILLCAALPVALTGQGTLVTDSVASQGLVGNALGDNPVRPVVIYLPPSYRHEATRRYPVLYMLHGANSTPEEWLDGKTYQGMDLKLTLDSLIAARAIPELIVVMPNSDNALGAGWYANSPALGNWEDFVVNDVLHHVETTYRTEARRDRRALYGHSMGGFGALAIGFRHPDLFGFVSVASPALVAMTGPIGPAGQPWVPLGMVPRWQDAPARIRPVLGMAAALDGNKASPRLFDSLPYRAGPGGALVADPAELRRWEAKMPPDLASAMVRSGARPPVLMIETGNEETPFLEQIRALKGRLDSLHLAYSDTVFTGGHIDRVRDRLTNHVLPAVARWLGTGNSSGSRPLLDSAKTHLAVIDGTVPMAGLDSSVEVLRDQWGVPHIYAKTVHDLFFAQGYVAAQDRLFQMEMWRRQGDGTTAEVLGKGAVERDKFSRLFKYRGDMAREWESYGQDARAIVSAFVAGVNAHIAEVREHPPIEFELLGFKPEPWTVDVPLQRMAALEMTGNALGEVDRANLITLYGKAKVEALFPLDPARKLDPVPGLDLTGVTTKSLGAAEKMYTAINYPRFDGSNNWVVDGKRTASGKPLLANDPHRSITLPSLRYLTHLVGPGWDVIGAGEPALPGVAGGHNKRVAFGFTIVGMDQQDVYVEKIGPCPKHADRRCYWMDGAWQPVRVIPDTIRVKGESPRPVTLEFTVHGPIVGEDSARHRAYVIKFVGTEPGTAGYLAQIAVDRANDWPTFKSAVYRWRLPTENMIYADVDGNIGWIAAGLNPVRSWSGLLPVPGDGRYEWKGFTPYWELPQKVNPASGVIATSNNNIMPPGYPHQLNYEWASPYRANRSTQQLEGRRDWTRDGFEKLQHDEYSIPASQLVPVLVAAGKALRLHDPALEAMGKWGYTISKDGAEPLIYEAWLRALGPAVYKPRLGDKGRGRGRGWDLQHLIQLVRTPDASFGRHPAAGRDSVVLAAYTAAMDTLRKQFGSDWTRWRYGTVHKAPFHHPLATAFDLPDASRGGDDNTLNVTSGTGWTQTHGASYRGIFDTADWDNSVATNVPGQSGQPGSEYYDNLLPLWEKYQYFPLVYSRGAVEKETRHRLVLEPKR